MGLIGRITGEQSELFKSQTKFHKAIYKHRQFLRERKKAAKKYSKLGLRQKAARIGQSTRSSKQINEALDWDSSKLK